MNEAEIEQQIVEKGLTGPRITPEFIDALIVAEQYHVFKDTSVTVCCLTLANGFCVVGHSACASRQNFDEEIGRKIAQAEARDKIWELEGYRLRQKLSDLE